MFAEVLDQQHEFMFPIVLPNLLKKFYCSWQVFVGSVGQDQPYNESQSETVQDMETHFLAWKNYGRSPKSDSGSTQSLLWDQKASCVKDFTSTKVRSLIYGLK